MLMKTFIQVSAIVAVLALSSAVSADKTFYWDDYNIQITVPDDFKIVEDTPTEFEMKGDGMELAMSIFNDKNVGIADMDEATVAAAKEMKLQQIDEEEAFKNADFEGYYVEGYKDGSRVMFAGVIDTASRTNFFIVIIFDDKDKEAEKEALNILSSIDHK